jgi:hypothetical protein
LEANGAGGLVKLDIVEVLGIEVRGFVVDGGESAMPAAARNNIEAVLLGKTAGGDNVVLGVGGDDNSRGGEMRLCPSRKDIAKVGCCVGNDKGTGESVGSRV